MTDHTEPLDTASATLPLPHDLIAPEPPLDTPATATTSSATLRPRTRWAGIVWGLVFAALAGAGIWLTSGDGRVAELSAWVQGISPATAIGYGILIIGSLLLITGLVGLLRRAQRAAAARATGA